VLTMETIQFNFHDLAQVVKRGRDPLLSLVLL
jgi:hypothetical protein